jgi:hypothetical protein
VTKEFRDYAVPPFKVVLRDSPGLETEEGEALTNTLV